MIVVFVFKLLLVLLAVYALVVGRTLLRLRSFRFQTPTLRYSGLDEIAAGPRAILEQPRPWLLAQGFRQVAWLQGEEMIRLPGQGPGSPKSFFLSRDGRLRCTVLVSPLPRHGIPYLLRFGSTLLDGTELVTVNCAGPLPAPADMVVSDGYFPHDDEQLALHLAKTGGRECQAFRNFDELLEQHNRVGERLFHWWQRHQLVRHGGEWRLSWPGALRFFAMLLRHQRRLKQVPAPSRDLRAAALAALAASPPTRQTRAAGIVSAPVSAANAAARASSAASGVVRGAAAPATVPLAATGLATTIATATAAGSGSGASIATADAPAATALLPATAPLLASPEAAQRHAEAGMLAQWLDTEAAAAGNAPHKWRNFALTALAFIGFGYFFFDGGWSFIIALMLVLLVHELGHYAAMRAFGYRDLSIFFLPLLGAAATGRKDTAPPWQQLVILLAGPVPGLLLALAGGLAYFAAVGSAGAATLPPWALSFALECIVIALVVNALNLLPIMPLDGGRIAELLFFARYPRASFVFFGVGVAALGAGALAFSDPVLGVLAVVLALSLPFQWRLARVSRTLRPHFGQCPQREGALILLADAFGQGEARAWPPLTRLHITRSLLPRLQGGLPDLRTWLLGSVVYLGLLAAPLLTLLAVAPEALSAPGSAAMRLFADNSLQQTITRQEERLAQATTPEEKLRANLSLYHLLSAPQQDAAAQARAEAYLDAAWQLLPPARPLAAGPSALGVMMSYVQRRFERDPVAGLALHAELQLTLEKSAKPWEVARWIGLRDGLLLTQPAPLPARIGNREQEVALWEQALAALPATPAAAVAAGASAADIDAQMDLHQVRSGLVFARDALADLHYRAQQPTPAIALLRANRQQARAWFGDEFRYLRDRTLSRLAWACIVAGTPAEAEPLFSSYVPAPAPFEEFEDDPWSSPVPEQALGWVALATQRPADAVPIFARLSESVRENDPELVNSALVAAVDLDLLIAQQRAGLTAPAAATAQQLRQVVAGMPGGERYLAGMLEGAIGDPGNLAALRARAHRDALRALGYALPAKASE